MGAMLLLPPTFQARASLENAIADGGGQKACEISNNCTLSRRWLVTPAISAAIKRNVPLMIPKGIFEKIELNNPAIQ